MQGAHLALVPVPSLACSDPPLASHGSGTEMQTHYKCHQAHVIRPLPASPNSSPLLSSPSSFFLLLGQAKLAPAPGSLHLLFLTPGRLPRFFMMGLFSSVKSWHKCHFLGEAALTACLQVVPLSEALSVFNNLFYRTHNTCNRRICCLVLPYWRVSSIRAEAGFVLLIALPLAPRTMPGTQ